MQIIKRLLGCLLLGTFIAQAQDPAVLAKQRVDTNETPGIIIGVYENGKTQYYTAGYADVGGKQTIDSKTLFEIGSITKTFTNIALAEMVNEGKVSLDDPIQKFLPPTVTAPTRNGKSITFLDLATAHSGLPRLPWNLIPADGENPYIDYTNERLYTFLSGYSLSRDIGSQYEYSNLGMGLLGVLISRVDGKTYQQVISNRILTPLNMTSTFLNTPGRQDKNRALGYAAMKVAKPWTWTDDSAMQGAGGLISNAEDMMKYVIANLDANNTALGKAMTATHVVRSDAGKELKIGLGWHMRKEIIWHNGGTGGFRTFAGFHPATKKAVVVLTNSTTGADDIGFHLLDATFPLKEIK